MSNTGQHHSDKFTRRKKHLRQEITVICQRAVILEGIQYWEENDVGIPISIPEITSTVDQSEIYPVDFPPHAIHSNGYNHGLANQAGVEYIKGEGKWIIHPLKWLRNNSKHQPGHIANQYETVEEYNKDVNNKDVYPLI